MTPRDLESEWRAALEELGLGGAKLLQARREHPVQRVYRGGDRVYKLHLKCSAKDAERSRRLGVGFETTLECHDLSGVPRALWRENRPNVYVCVYEALQARPIHSPDHRWSTVVGGLMQLSKLLARLSWRGIAHNDLFPGNVLLADNGRCFLIDFDSATRGSRWFAFRRNFLRGRRKVTDGKPKWAYIDLVFALVSQRLRDWLRPHPDGTVGRAGASVNGTSPSSKERN